MRKLTLMQAMMAMAIVALLTVPSYSQEMSGGKRHGREQKGTQPSKKPDDKAYNAALSRIPNQRYDPWRTAR
jgi:hypothetical protein